MNQFISFLFIVILGTTSSFAQEYERYKKLVDTTISSQYLGFDKNITITVPFEWQADIDRKFPLIIIFDRQNKRSNNYILNTIDYLTSNEQMPSSVIISVESVSEHRYQETLFLATSENGQALENEKFIFDELIPMAENNYHASDFRLFIGHSRYGYFTSSLFHSRINELNAVISISPVFIQKNVDLTDSLMSLNNQLFESTKYYRFAIGNDYPEDFAKMDVTLKDYNNPSIDIKGTLFKEAIHNATPGLTISTSLYEIFEEWNRIQSIYFSNEQKEINIVNSLAEEIRTEYGSELVFSLGILNGKGWFFYSEGEFEKAIEAWELLMKFYPNYAEGYLYILDAQIQLKQNTAETVKRFNSSISSTTIFTEHEKSDLIKELENLLKP